VGYASEAAVVLLSNNMHSAAGFLTVRLDHRAGTLRFGAPGLESDRMREHIAQLARRLSTAQRMVQPAADPAVDQRRVAVS
jgi:translation initiation factor 3 subunit A